MNVRILHAADLHLDSPMRGVRSGSTQPPPTFQALTRLVDVALSESVDAVLLAGDLYDKKDESIAARLHLRKQLGRLSEAGIFSFLVHGNHDFLEVGEFRQLPPRVHLFQNVHQQIRVETKAGPLRVQGISHVLAETTENLSLHFHRTSPELTVGLLHANVAQTQGHAPYAPCSLEDLNRAELDYWALGHVHTRCTFELASGGVAAYPGNLAGRHVNEAGARGALLVEFDRHRKAAPSIQFVACDALRWHRCEVDISGCDSIEALFDTCLEAVEATLRAEPPDLEHVVRVTLSGARHPELAAISAEVIDQLSQSLVDSFPARRQLESVRDLSFQPVNMGELKERGALLAMLVDAFESGMPEAMHEAVDGQGLSKLISALKKARAEGVLQSVETLQKAGLRQAFQSLTEP